MLALKLTAVFGFQPWKIRDTRINNLDKLVRYEDS